MIRRSGLDTLQSAATDWVERYGLTDKVTFIRGDAGIVGRTLTGPFDLIFIDTEHDDASVTRDIEVAMPLLLPVACWPSTTTPIRVGQKCGRLWMHMHGGWAGSGLPKPITAGYFGLG